MGQKQFFFFGGRQSSGGVCGAVCRTGARGVCRDRPRRSVRHCAGACCGAGVRPRGSGWTRRRDRWRERDWMSVGNVLPVPQVGHAHRSSPRVHQGIRPRGSTRLSVAGAGHRSACDQCRPRTASVTVPWHPGCNGCRTLHGVLRWHAFSPRGKTITASTESPCTNRLPCCLPPS